jgi:hypothetical protein
MGLSGKFCPGFRSVISGSVHVVDFSQKDICGHVPCQAQSAAQTGKIVGYNYRRYRFGDMEEQSRRFVPLVLGHRRVGHAKSIVLAVSCEIPAMLPKGW